MLYRVAFSIHFKLHGWRTCQLQMNEKSHKNSRSATVYNGCFIWTLHLIIQSIPFHVFLPWKRSSIARLTKSQLIFIWVWHKFNPFTTKVHFVWRMLWTLKLKGLRTHTLLTLEELRIYIYIGTALEGSRDALQSLWPNCWSRLLLQDKLYYTLGAIKLFYLW